MKILVTGSAGFIGFHLVKLLIAKGAEVVGMDNINDYYDVQLKYDRLSESGIDQQRITYGVEVNSNLSTNYTFVKLDLIDNKNLRKLFKKHQFDAVCNLAAQAGVRYSLINPSAYVESNIRGFVNLLESCRNEKIKHLVYASSSSVYGLNQSMPFCVDHSVNHPISLYAATKKSNELMAHTYSHLFNLPTTGLRFFTVYGPWGRPDMALFLFTKAMLKGEAIKVFNDGKMKRDFTYVDDVVGGIWNVLNQTPQGDKSWDANNPKPGSSTAPYRVFNIGRGNSVSLMEFVSEIEKNMGIICKKEFLPMQDGDVEETWADIRELQEELKYHPQVSVREGVKNFVDWFKHYYALSEQEA